MKALTHVLTISGCLDSGSAVFTSCSTTALRCSLSGSSTLPYTSRSCRSTRYRACSTAKHVADARRGGTSACIGTGRCFWPTGGAGWTSHTSRHTASSSWGERSRDTVRGSQQDCISQGEAVPGQSSSHTVTVIGRTAQPLRCPNSCGRCSSQGLEHEQQGPDLELVHGVLVRALDELVVALAALVGDTRQVRIPTCTLPWS